MKNVLFILLFIPFHCLSQLSSKQNLQIESLKNVIKKAKHDTTVVKAWQEWDNIIYVTDPELDFVLNLKIDSLCTINLNKKIDKKSRLTFLKTQAFALNNLGNIYGTQGNYAKAIENYTRSLKIDEKIKHNKGIATSLNNIGSIYKEQGEIQKAISNFNQSLKIYAKLGNKQGMASCLNNLGSIYHDIGDTTKAIYFHARSLKYKEEINDNFGIAVSLNNIGTIYEEKGENTKALSYYYRSFKAFEEIGDKQNFLGPLINMANIHFKNGELTKAIEYAKRTLTIAQEVGNADGIRNGSDLLFGIYKKKGNYKAALEMFELFIATKDSIQSEENQKEIFRQEYKYKYEKKTTADSVANAKQQEIKNAEIARQKAEIKAKRNQQFLLFGGLALVFIFALIMYNRFKVTARQKKEIEEQKLLVEEKQKEILDSIIYARRIQKALLPSDKYILKSINRTKS